MQPNQYQLRVLAQGRQDRRVGFKVAVVGHFEHAAIREGMKENHWNKKVTADFLGMKLHAFIKMLRLEEIPLVFTEQQRSNLQWLTHQTMEDLFPDYIRQIKFLSADQEFVKTYFVSREMAAAGGAFFLPPSPDNGVMRTEQRRIMDQVVGTLPPMQRKVIKLRFFESFTLNEIAEELGTNRDTVFILERKALRNLRKPERARPLKAFL